MISLSQIYIHPVKSMRGLGLSHAQVATSGLAFDRIFMITEPDGTFITARKSPQMVLFTPAILQDGLYLSAPDGSSSNVRFNDFLSHPAPTSVWGNHFTAFIAPDDINIWLSSFFSRPVQLRWLGHLPTRRVKHFDEVPLSFADGFPFLLTNESSLRDLQSRCPASVKMTQFRPNMVITGAQAWAEDTWQAVRIGDITFDVVRPCTRCILTTISPEKGHQHPGGEPLTTLQTFRTAEDNGDVDFGQNLIARHSGIIRVCDKLEVLATKPSKIYGAGEVTERVEVPAQLENTISIGWQGKAFRGNNQQILLEQLEQQGISIPYSCRAGVCGNCRIRLVDGVVKPLKKSAVGNDGTILCCSCIPAGDVRLEML